jgi:transposase
MDLHSNNVYAGILAEDGTRIFSARLPCDLAEILQRLEPYRKDLEVIGVESTYNWYWLVDGLIAKGLNTVLANPAQMGQYDGLKHTDDKTDAFWIAEMLRLNILPTGHIYDPAQRPLRDLLRRRLWFVHQRTRGKLSLQSMFTRHTGAKLSADQSSHLTDETLTAAFDHVHTRLQAKLLALHIEYLGKQIEMLEAEALAKLRTSQAFNLLQTVPGIGKILAMTILMETGPISRFASAGDYASYARCVKSKKLSNGKKKGKGNEKNGNKYLAWAWIEAANFVRRYHPPAQRFHQRKTDKRCAVLATKALAAKMAKSGYYIMRDLQPFDSQRLFGS